MSQSSPPLFEAVRGAPLANVVLFPARETTVRQPTDERRSPLVWGRPRFPLNLDAIGMAGLRTALLMLCAAAWAAVVGMVLSVFLQTLVDAAWRS